MTSRSYYSAACRVGCLALMVSGSACAPAGGDAVSIASGAIVYGADGRAEHYQLAEPGTRDLMALSTVALIENRWIDRSGRGIAAAAPIWNDVGALCPGEPFSEQPAAAFCSGLLIDWDLVVTAGHCLRLFALKDFSVVFGYFYAAPGQLAMDGSGAGEVLEPVEIVDEMLGRDVEGRELDYAFVRLVRRASAPRRPAPVYRMRPELEIGMSIATVGAGHGLPLKADTGGLVLDTRLFNDYFVASTDTSHGWSGGGAFDAGGVLVGVLARGNDDLLETSDGCFVESHGDDAAGQEEFTYVHRMLERLCVVDPSVTTLCRADCAEPCEALPYRQRVDASVAGCAVASGAATPAAPLLCLLAMFLGQCVRGHRGRFRGTRTSSASALAVRKTS